MSVTTLGQPAVPHTSTLRVVFVGNPNAGKTSLFNALTGVRAKTANFPGTTTELREGHWRVADHNLTMVDLPGMYSLRAASPDERVAAQALLGYDHGEPVCDLVICVVDATNLERNLYLVSEIRDRGLPMIVALNMSDLATRQGMHIDLDQLRGMLGCPVVQTAATVKNGTRELEQAIADWLTRREPGEAQTAEPMPADPGTPRCEDHERYAWAESIVRACVSGDASTHGSQTERLDRVLTHPIVGMAIFLTIMLGVFYLIFSFAALPMELIDHAFGSLANWLAARLPEGDVNSLLTEGIIPGVGGVLVFLPQICVLFFFISLLEDTGYLARATFVMDRLMRRFGLPGKAFVPMLSAHACAIPAIMSAKVIQDKRDRLATILVLPLMTCSARLPVYVMITALLFPNDQFLGALVFTGAYVLGVVAAVSMAFVLKRTVLPGESRPLILELPGYRRPNLRNALLLTWDRGLVFLKKAGTVILAISVVLWALSTYPKLDESTLPAPTAAAVAADHDLAQQAQLVGDTQLAESIQSRIDHRIDQESIRYSFAGRLGRLIEPAIEPLGFNWQIGVGLVSSFAAREVVVSTLSIVYGVGGDQAEDSPALLDTLRNARREDGSILFTTATSLSLLVFFVLAMQCLPTQVVTRRETGSWKWALLQLGYMTALAFTASLITYQGLRLLGVS